ncbi:hypothetical protein POM88_026187 [Heracleum sosnowskyi]|uniref:Uncharacterized protein n=1 Tax=Heracleum sosnowskyi TaxID=360622 RepID=A0AAD8MPQ9_9APIA|nr:hypothetical protein POM88_026187 [Heracleum sosnowskyi]
MASSSFMNKQTVISGVTFATNNFVAVLGHQDLPSEFHIIQDFLASSQLKFALTEPASVSFKSVMQVWNSVSFEKDDSGSILMSFEYDGVNHCVTPAIVEEALHLPILGDAVPDNVSDSTLFEFVTKLGYNGEVKRYGNLFRTKLKKEWNYFFDTISRCFLNKTSNFDALPSGSLKIGITENNIKSLVNSDKANGFTGTAYIPDEVRLFLQEKMPTCYGLVSDAMGQGQSHLVPNPSIQPKQSKQSTATSIVSQKTLVVKTKKSARIDVSGRQSEVADTAIEAMAQSSKPQKKRKLTKNRYHIPLDKKQDTDGQDTSIPDEQSNPDAQSNPDVGNYDDAPSQVIAISESPVKASPPTRHIDIPWEKLGVAASKLGFTHPLDKKRKAEEIVFIRQKKLKGSSPQEPESQCDSAATKDPAPQEPLNQSLGEGIAIGMVPQEPFSQRENADTSIPATQEPSSQCEDAGKATASEEFPDNAQGVSGAYESARLVEDTVIEGSIAISDPDVPNNSDADDSDDDNKDEKDQLATTIKSSLGTNFGSSSTFMAGKATSGKDLRQDFSGPSEIIPAELFRKDEWNNSWYRSDESVSYPYVLDHVYDAVKLIENEDLKNHLKATTLLSKSLKHEIDSVKVATDLVRGDIAHNFTKVPTALQLRIVESQVKSVISEQSSIHSKIDSLDSKVSDIQTSLALILNILSNPDVKMGEKVSQTKCTPNLLLRNNDDDTGNDGGDKVLQGETSDAAVVKSTIQTSQSQTTQSTHVFYSGVRTVRTLVQSQILMEEQILTGDQILMNDQILTPGHGQILSTIPEGDEDATNLFQKFKIKDGNVVTLYHTDKRVQQLFARKALSTASEEYPDLSHEEFLNAQREMMESFKNPAPARGRGCRGRRGARRGRKGSSISNMPRQTRSRGLRIEEISNVPQISIVPDIQPDRTIFGDERLHEEFEPQMRRSSRQSTLISNTTQIEDSNPDTVPDTGQDPDESDILQEVDLLILSEVVDSHNREVDEEEEARRREITRTTSIDINLYLQKLKIQTSCYGEIQEDNNTSWKGAIVTDFADSQRSRALWLQMFSNLRKMTSNTRGGIGHRDAEFLNIPHVDPHALTEIGGILTSEHLNNLLAVDIVIDCHDGTEKKEKLLYFMKDGSVKVLTIQELLFKSTKELKYVHYLLRWKNKVYKE